MNDSQAMRNPNGGVEGERRIAQPALHVALMEEVLAAENLRRAWMRVRIPAQRDQSFRRNVISRFG